MTIYFYKTNDEYGCFSNFALYPFVVDGMTWYTSEHYFQAHKFLDEKYFDKIRMAESPMKAANLGRSRKVAIRDDWENVKDNIMRRAVYEKFTQNEEILRTLLYTGDQEIVEATTNDYYWGCGQEGNGKNMLGVILMELREELRNTIML